MIEALQVFATCGLFNYTNSVYLHLQNMSDVQRKNKSVYKQFKEGKFVVQKKDKWYNFRFVDKTTLIFRAALFSLYPQQLGDRIPPRRVSHMV